MGDPDASDDSGDDDGAESDRHAERSEGESPPENGGHDDAETPEDDTEDDRYGEGFTPGDSHDPGSPGERDRGVDTSEEYESLRETLEDLREDVDEFEAEIEDRTVHREEIEDDLRSYVRKRLRRGHARGWGPYLVLLYGTAMTVAAFVELAGVWAILAMIVIWLSTLGLYVLMLLVGLGINALSTPGRAVRAAQGLIDTLRNVRS